MLQENSISSKEEGKRRKSAQINNFPSISSIQNNLNTSYKSTSDLCNEQPIFNSNSLFAYQELDQFSSFCDDYSNKSEFLSDFYKKGQNNNNINNNSTKNEDGEESENADESFENDNISEDEIFFKKYNQRMKKRKSALHSSSYLKNLSFLNKPNEFIYTNNFSNSDKKNKNEMNNNIKNSNFIPGINLNPYNIRRNSHPINQFNNIFFNNILYPNHQNFPYPNNIYENNNTNKINDKNNYMNNNINNLNNNNSQNFNFNPNIQNQMSSFNNPSPNNFQNYNYIQNFPYNKYYNNNNSTGNCININNNNINNKNLINPNSNKKKRNSQIIINQIFK